MEVLPRITNELVRSALYMSVTLLAIYIIALLDLNPIGFFVYGLGALFATHRLFMMARQKGRPAVERAAIWVIVGVIWGSLLVIDFLTRYFVSNG